MEKIEITHTSEPCGWFVRQGDKASGGLTYDEMIGLVVTLTMLGDKMDSFGKMSKWMKTDAEREKINADFVRETP